MNKGQVEAFKATRDCILGEERWPKSRKSGACVLVKDIEISSSGHLGLNKKDGVT